MLKQLMTFMWLSLIIFGELSFISQTSKLPLDYPIKNLSLFKKAIVIVNPEGLINFLYYL